MNQGTLKVCTYKSFKQENIPIYIVGKHADGGSSVTESDNREIVG